MKKLYFFSLLLFCLFQLGLREGVHAQCVSGNTSDRVMMDTTFYFETGVTSTEVKFPQFDPEQGMVRCVKLIVTMVGVIDSVTMQNKSTGNTTANFYYIRTDDMTGPGLTSSLSNSINKRYGPYSLTPYDGNTTSGTDFVYIENDTALKATIVRTLNDSVEISQFYGTDSVVYNYDISVMTSASIGGTGSSAVATSAFVNFRFEYCVCPKVTLPVGLKKFALTKTGSQAASVYWEGTNDDYLYAYDIEMSRDGNTFSTIASVDRKYTAAPTYFYSFSAPQNDYGKYFFRVRQRWQNGHVQYTPVKTVDFMNPVFANVSLYPNPSTGKVGVKFVNTQAGRMMIQVAGAGGQQVMTKEVQVTETDYKIIGTLPSGIYWIKITDMATKASCVKQLVIQ